LTYSKKPDGFGSPIEQNVGGKHSEQLPEAEDEISVTAVNDFLKEMPAFFQSYQMSSIEDLGFTENDYQQCKKDILAFKQSLEDPGKAPKKKNNNGKTTAFHFAENNLDFDRLLNLVDSIKHIDAGRLNSILGSLSEVWSTTTNSTSFTLVNNKGEELSFSSNYFEPNPYYFPWTVSLNGCITFSTSMTINNFIREIYPNLLDEKNKVAVLHTIVKRLY
jgi:hypothetical protein